MIEINESGLFQLCLPPPTSQKNYNAIFIFFKYNAKIK